LAGWRFQAKQVIMKKNVYRPNGNDKFSCSFIKIWIPIPNTRHKKVPYSKAYLNNASKSCKYFYYRIFQKSFRIYLSYLVIHFFRSLMLEKYFGTMTANVTRLCEATRSAA
jgi:hypothetical protein